MTEPLRVGVIGLGPLWNRQYAPALRGLRDRFEVAAVCDQVQERAARVAKRLDCPAAGGPTDLLQRDGIDALLQLDAQWYGLWAAGRACAVGKPVFCCPPAGLTGAEGEALRRQAEARGVPVVPALPLRVLPALAALRELLTYNLGGARVVLASAGVPGPAGLTLLDLLDACAALFEGQPARVTRADTPELCSVVLDYGGGRSAQLTEYRSPFRAGPARLEVLAGKGRAELRLPDRLSWCGPNGRWAHRSAPGPSPARALLEQFHGAARGEAAAPGLGDVARLLGLLAAPPAPCG
jgi:predicted dehydrogenase